MRKNCRRAWRGINFIGVNLPPPGGLLLTHPRCKHFNIFGSVPLIRYRSYKPVIYLPTSLNVTCPPLAGDRGGGMNRPFAFTIISMNAFPIIYKPCYDFSTVPLHPLNPPPAGDTRCRSHKYFHTGVRRKYLQRRIAMHLYSPCHQNHTEGVAPLSICFYGVIILVQLCVFWYACLIRCGVSMA